MRTQQTLCRGLAAALSLIVLTAGSEAEAQDRKPVIDKILYANRMPTTRAPKGGVVILVGRNFHKCLERKIDEKTGKREAACKHPGMTVTVDSVKAVIYGTNFDEITLQIPQSISPGRRKQIKVSFSGRGSDKTSIEVMGVKEWKKTKEGKAEEEGEVGGGIRARAERQGLEAFKITFFRAVPGGVGHSFVVKGLARNVPDNLRIEITLRYDNRAIRKRIVPVKGGKFDITFGPYSQRLLTGHYAAELVFSMARQSRPLLRLWMNKLKQQARNDSAEFKRLRQAFKKIVKREYTTVGGTGPKGAVTPGDLAKQLKDVQLHSRGLARETTELMESLKQTYASACRSYWKYEKKRGYNEDAWMAWLKDSKNGFGLDDEKIEELKDEKKFANSQGGFRSGNFEKWVREEFLPKLKKVHAKHVEFNKRYICVMDERAERLGHFLIDNVVKLFQKWTFVLYQKSEYEMPLEFARAPFMAVSAPRVSLKYFAAKKRELFKQVKLNSDGTSRD